MWIRTSGKTLSRDIANQIVAIVGERDRVDDYVWLDLSSGGRVVLTMNGGWRRAEESAYHALYVSPAGDVIDASWGLLGGKVPLDSSSAISAASRHRQQACAEHLERLLGVTAHRVNYGQDEAVQNP